MKPLLCKAGQQLREQIDDAFPDRDRKSDGWIGDAAHANRKSDHNPDPSNGIVRAIDVDKNLDTRASTGSYLADQIRVCAKKDKRIAYVIYSGRIASAKSLWRWRTSVTCVLSALAVCSKVLWLHRLPWWKCQPLAPRKFQRSNRKTFTLQSEWGPFSG